MKEPNAKCEQCGKPFYRRPYQIRQGIVRCCSLACGILMRGVQPPEVRFWKYVQKSDGCWLWTGNTNPNGYGVLKCFDGTKHEQLLAHRISYALHVGEVPDGLCVLHNCPDGDNPLCVNPDHLFLGTKADNSADMVAKQRQVRGAAHFKTQLNDPQVAEMKRRHAAGERPIDLARDFNVTAHVVCGIVHGKAWKHVPPA